MLSPIQLQENLNEDKQMHIPQNFSEVGPTEMAKEYRKSETEDPIKIIKEMCTYTAMELSCEPDIRKGLKKHIYDFGMIKTQPTDKGRETLDVFHPSYRTKNVDAKLNSLAETDLFIDVMQM